MTFKSRRNLTLLIAASIGCKAHHGSTSLHDIPIQKSYGACHAEWKCVGGNEINDKIFSELFGANQSECFESLEEKKVALRTKLSGICSSIEFGTSVFQVIPREGLLLSCESGIGQKICKYFDRFDQFLIKARTTSKYDRENQTFLAQEIESIYLGLIRGVADSNHLGTKTSWGDLKNMPYYAPDISREIAERALDLHCRAEKLLKDFVDIQHPGSTQTLIVSFHLNWRHDKYRSLIGLGRRNQATSSVESCENMNKKQ